MTCLALALAVSLCVPAAGPSGNEGSIEGTVTDTTGAVIVGVDVTARNVDTAAMFRSVTNHDGVFRFLVVPVGTYEITAVRAGFMKFVQERISVAVGAKITLPIELRVGTLEEVTVNGAAPVIEPTRTSFSSTIGARSVAAVPLNGRNFLNLALLTPAIANTGGALNSAFYNVAGQISMNSLLVDGADHNGFLSQPVGSAMGNRYLFSQEAIQEIQVNTGSYSAEFGRAGTAVINVITKSGTNQFHGSAFWYYRDKSLNATGYIEKRDGKPKSPHHANQFGGAAGGPVSRDRLFFYVSYDGQRRSERPLIWMNLPPGFACSPKPDVSEYQWLALDYLCARTNSYMRTFDQNVTLGKLDWHISDRHSLSGQWNRHRLEAPNMIQPGPQTSFEHNGTDGQVADTLNASLTSVLSSRTVNVARVSYVSTHTPQTANSNNPEAQVVQSGQTVLWVGRLPKIADNGVRHLELADMLSLDRGRHTPKLGGSVLVERAQFLSTLNFFGAYKFNSLESFGRSLAGKPAQPGDQYTQAFSAEGKSPIDVSPDYVELAAFVQDAWHVRPRLTLDLGVRYDVQLMQQSSVLNPAPELLAAGVDTRFIPTDANNIAPRAGFAWTPDRGGRAVVRGGYGLFYPRFPAGTAVRPFFQNGITTQTRTFVAPDIPAYPATKCGALDPSGAAPNCAAPVGGSGKDMIMAIAHDYRQSAVQQGSAGVEYALRPDLAVSVTYLRVKGDHLMHWQDINLGDPVTGTIGIANTNWVLTYPQYPKNSRPMAAFGRVFLLETNGHSSYHGLVVQMHKRWSRNFQFDGSYTISRVVDDNPTDGALNPGPGDPALLSDSRDPNVDRGPGDFGQHHRVVLHGIWALDYAGGLQQPARAILSDWEVSGVVSANSGFPYSPLLNYDLNGDGNLSTDRTPGLGRNTFVLPASAVVDVRLSRTVRLNRVRMQVGCDAFNLFNRTNVNGVQTTQFSVSQKPGDCGIAGTPCLVTNTAFGTATGASDPRMIQFSVRFSF